MTLSVPQDALITASKRLLRYRIPLALALVANCIMLARVPLRGMLASDARLQDVTRQQPVEQSPVPSVESQADSATQPAPAASGLCMNNTHPEVQSAMVQHVAKPTTDLPAETTPPHKTAIVRIPVDPTPQPAPQLGPATAPPAATARIGNRITPTESANIVDVTDVAKHMTRMLRTGVADIRERVARKTAQWADRPVAIVAQMPTWLPQEPKQPTATKQRNTATPTTETVTNATPKLSVSRPNPEREDAISLNVETKQLTSDQHKTEYRWSVRNPTENHGMVSFLVDGKIYSLASGQSRTFSTTEEQTVRFDRGADFGAANQKVRQGQFKFTVTDTGWHLVPAK